MYILKLFHNQIRKSEYYFSKNIINQNDKNQYLSWEKLFKSTKKKFYENYPERLIHIIKKSGKNIEN